MKAEINSGYCLKATILALPACHCTIGRLGNQNVTSLSRGTVTRLPALIVYILPWDDEARYRRFRPLWGLLPGQQRTAARRQGASAAVWRMSPWGEEALCTWRLMLPRRCPG